MRVSVDRSRCCGAGQCAATAPEVFDQSEEDGLAVLSTEQPGEGHWAAVRMAATLCPASAISVREHQS
ncbi:ferredoxin [Amycolatopsis sp. NPDC059657]|uniref:ferredoxin n=1 Tax=Amycolatopsis sp. NPDC059657 TaxID=3346899 RepID=UPI0036717109